MRIDTKSNVDKIQKRSQKIEEQFQQKKKHINKRNEERQEQLSKLYIDTKYERFYIIDFIKIEYKESMIEGLKKIFRYEELSDFDKTQLHFENIPDFTKTGILLSTGCSFRGTLHNEKYYSNPVFLHGPIRQLPDFLDRMEVFIHNYDDKFFCIVFKCVINDNYKNSDLKNAFLHKDDFITILKGNMISSTRKINIHEVDPILNDKIRKMVDFLSEYTEGLFINKSDFFKKENAIPPNIKIFSIKNINFPHFKQWQLKNREFLDFLDMQYPFYSQYEELLISDQRSRSFGTSSTNAGLVFLFSFKHIEPKNGFTTKEGYADCALDQTVEMLLPTFYLYHKTNFMVESKISYFEKQKNNLKKNILEKRWFLGNYFYKIMNIYNEYQDLYFLEKIHLKELHNIRRQSRYDFNFKHLLHPNCNVSDGLKNGSTELLNIEGEDLENTRQEFENLIEFNKSLTDFILQKRINILTIVVVILTIILVIFGIYQLII